MFNCIPVLELLIFRGESNFRVRAVAKERKGREGNVIGFHSDQLDVVSENSRSDLLFIGC